jgi:ATP-dependent helicase HrpA
VRAALSAAAGGLERSGATTWAFGDLPAQVETERNGRTMIGYPALVDEGDSVGVRVLDDREARRRAMVGGTRRLILLALPSPRKAVAARLDRDTQLELARGVTGRLTDLLDDAVAVAVDALVDERGGPATDAESFEALLAAVRPDVVDRAAELLTTAAPALADASRVRERLAALADPLLAPAVVDVERQLDHLVGPGFLARAGAEHLPHLPRYLTALRERLDKLPVNPRRDLEHVTTLATLLAEIDEVAARLGPDRRGGADALRWNVEELRVSLFAQHLGTAHPVSAKRIRRALADLT